MGEEGWVEVTVRYKGLEKTVRGDPNAVVSELMAFFANAMPGLEVLSRISLSVDMEGLLRDCEGVIALTPEGLVITAPVDFLPDRELILFHLALAKIAHSLGKAEGSSLTSSELANRVKRSPGTIAGRVSELCSEGFAERVGKGEYRATTYGLDHFRRAILPKVKQRTEG
ncbi:MAG: hypothetical protein QXW19_04735 [Candidatus Bathyarchaeia archaeon]